MFTKVIFRLQAIARIGVVDGGGSETISVPSTSGRRELRMRTGIFFSMAGRTVAGGNAVVAIGESAGSTATVVAFQTVLDRMSAPSDKSESLPQAAWPTDTYTVDHKDLTGAFLR